MWSIRRGMWSTYGVSMIHIVHPFTHRRPSHTSITYIAYRSHIIDGSDVPYGCIIIINDTKSILVHDSVAPRIQAFSLVVCPRILLPYLLTCIKGDRIIFHVGYLNRRHSSISEERLYTRCAERVYDIFDCYRSWWDLRISSAPEWSWTNTTSLLRRCSSVWATGAFGVWHTMDPLICSLGSTTKCALGALFTQGVFTTSSTRWPCVCLVCVVCFVQWFQRCDIRGWFILLT